MNQIITVPFKPHSYQDQLYKVLKRFSVFVCHRRFGKTVFTINLLVKWALATKRIAWRAAYIAPFFRQAEAIAWDYLQFYTSVIPSVHYDKTRLRCDFPNGSRIELLGADNEQSLRGPYWDAVVFDEYAQIRPNAFPEIIRPALTDRKGWAIFIGTPQGHNHFYDLWKEANKKGEEGKEWAAVMYKASQTTVLDPEELASARETLSPEQYEQEFECSFEASLLGAYYGSLIQDAAIDGRIRNIPHDPILPVHTAWDLGIDDANVIWFFQLSPGGEIRLIDYDEQNNLGLDSYVRLIKEKKYVYGQHLAPHDMQSREWKDGRSRLEAAESLGIRFNVVPKTAVVEQIQAVRSILPRCWFDERRCDRGIQALKAYRKEYSQKLSTYKNNPLHDWASHGASAFATLANGLNIINPMFPVLKIKTYPSYTRGEHAWML